MNNPIPSNLKSEAKKAAKILREFTEITSRNGPDKIIPAHVIAKAKGLAILSVIKAGFLVTARGGSGVVLARLPDGSLFVLGKLNPPIEVTALYSFEGQQPGDLNFHAGDRITVISQTDSHFDWWEGKLRGQTGIFPANYVTLN
ncbi:SH3 domain-containing YSC84-like protein 1 [Leptonychotes weddellii]|uniref:SH3 domain-containing YSC84-like protein 1 n=1 Tax=Leptonychotes weddellii TaxID=9713 RepID=A0A7F8R769_LEPWE|nr:SH3 domain-containing YSC84-like protein 1 [Leptonychotes weddellii]